jgi:hypothetical protein
MAENTLEERISLLEDIEEIKKVKAKYCYNVDAFKTDELLELFSESAVLDFRPHFPELVGKKEIYKFYREDLPTMLRMCVHQILNGIVEVNGDKAKGTWYMWGIATFITPQGDTAAWSQVTYEDEFVKENGQWKISRVRDIQKILSPYEDGWVKTPIMGA